jgi:hypothetical protein
MVAIWADGWVVQVRVIMYQEVDDFCLWPLCSSFAILCGFSTKPRNACPNVVTDRIEKQLYMKPWFGVF